MMATINPYWGKDFFEIWGILLQRIVQMLSGKLPMDQWASDEVQCFVLSLVAIASALIGSFLVLKKMAMLANSLSHTILLGIIISYLIFRPSLTGGAEPLEGISIPVLFFAALMTALATSLLTQGLTHFMKLQEDASIGLVFTTLFALSIVLVTVFTRNTHIGVEAIMGNVDALHVDDLKIVFMVGLIDLIAVLLFFKEFTMTSFDQGLTRALGFSPSFFNYLLMVLASATVIAAFRAVGVLLVLALLVGPILSARLWTDNLKKLILLSIVIGVVCSFCSVALSRHILTVFQAPLSTSGLVVCLIGVVFGSSLLFSPKKGIVWKKNRVCG